MGPKVVRVCYVEDSPTDREKYVRRLKGPGIQIEAFPPPPDLEIGRLLASRPDLLLIDYELEKHRQPVNYSGAILSTKIREKFPGHPVVLLTRRSLLVKTYPQVGDLQGTFDEILYKDGIEEDPGGTAASLISLAKGFIRLRAIRKKGFQSLVQLLVARDEEVDLLRRAGPPPQAGSSIKHTDWRIPEAAKWIRAVVLRYPGILLDELHAATALGIAVESFEIPKVQRLFAPAKYRGVFEPPEGRWWRGRLYALAQKTIGTAKMPGPSHLRFAEAFRKRYKATLKPAVCISSKEAPADWVCYILEKPVKREFSIPYHPDDRPPVMDEARVSFTAIQRGSGILPEFFDSESSKLVEKILAGHER